MSFFSSFLTQIPLRASADVNTCRVIKLSGNYTAAQAADELDEPLGISVEFTRDAPLPGASTLAAKVANGDPVSFYGRGQKGHAVVGTGGLSGAGRVMADSDGSGRVVAAVAPCWSVGYVGEEEAPEDSKVEVFVDPVYIPEAPTS